MFGKQGMTARLLGIAAVLALAAPVSAVTVPFSEDFSADAAGWLNTTSGPLTWNAAGGPDGSAYVSTNAPSQGAPQGTIHFRANDAANASGDAFVGNWITSGVDLISAYVIHDAPAPVTFFFRFAGPGGGNAMVAITAPVAPNTWTQISSLISPAALTSAGGSFGVTMANVLNLQVGVIADAPEIGMPFTYGVDQVTIVPEPATAGMLACGLVLLAAGRRRDAQR
jgi:hypothetical protein